MLIPIIKSENKQYKHIVLGKVSNIPYRYLGENTFENLHTKKQGNVDENKAKDVFKINLDLIEITAKSPMIETFIERLGLKII